VEEGKGVSISSAVYLKDVICTGRYKLRRGRKGLGGRANIITAQQYFHSKIA
jgi:hypothetical protein